MTGRSGPVIALALLALGAGAWWWWPPAPQAPDATFKLIDGRRLTLAELRGGPVLVNFWSTSCPSCITDMPGLVTLHEEYSERGLAIIGVAMPYDPPNRVVEFATARSLPYAIALDLDTSLVRSFGDIRATPTHILIAPDGRIIERHVGPLRLAHTRDAIDRLLEES